MISRRLGDRRSAILNASQRNLRSAELPEDPAAMLHARTAPHPQHLIRARSRVPRPEHFALFIQNMEQEFGTIGRLPSHDAVPDAAASYLTGQNLPPELAIAPDPPRAG